MCRTNDVWGRRQRVPSRKLHLSSFLLPRGKENKNKQIRKNKNKEKQRPKTKNKEQKNKKNKQKTECDPKGDSQGLDRIYEPFCNWTTVSGIFCIHVNATYLNVRQSPQVVQCIQMSTSCPLAKVWEPWEIGPFQLDCWDWLLYTLHIERKQGDKNNGTRYRGKYLKHKKEGIFLKM